MKKVLIFTTRQMCYDSAGFFAKKIAMNLESLGVDCELCMFAEDDIPGRIRLFAAEIKESDCLSLMPEAEKCLEQYLGKEYMAVIDFNSKLPRVVMEDGSLFLNHLKAPFINYILDHPLYHHSMLSSPLESYYVITPDENHAAYIRTFYPNIKGVLALPLGATEARSSLAWEDSAEEILFMGTYHDPKSYYEEILAQKDKKGLPTKEDLLFMIEYMQSKAHITLEEALSKVFMDKYGMQPKENKELFRLWANYSYLVEIYLRNEAREQAIRSLLNAGLPVKTVGDWWENLSTSKDLLREEAVTFARSYGKIAQYKVLLNSSPFFQGGMHDRIPAAMANHTLVLTDQNAYLQRELGEKNAIYMYRLSDEKEFAELAKEALYSNEARIREKNAYEMFQMRYTWLQIAQKVLQYIDSFSQ